MRRYIDYAVYWDTIAAIIIGVLIVLLRQQIKLLFASPSIDNINDFADSLITVCAAIIGFLLTIITVIVTFQNGFRNIVNNSSKVEIDPNGIPSETIFERHKTSEDKFYGTEIHKKVVDVFVYATYEMGMILFLLILFQLNALRFTIFTLFVICISLFLMFILTIIRSLFIFKLFLNVHLHEKPLNKYK
jgi:hypothetical protein